MISRCAQPSTLPPWLPLHFVQEGEGIWRSDAAEVEPLSYLESGHAVCFECEDESFWFAHRNNCLRALLERHSPRGALLDVGGGNGFVSRALIDAGCEVVLLEPGLTGARNAVRRGIPTVVCGTLHGAHFPEEVVPAIGLFDVLEHIAGDEQFLRECHRVLIPNGRIYLTVPALQWLWSDDDVQAGHFRRYRRQQLEMLLRKSGFRVLGASYFFSFLPPALFFCRCVPSLFGRRPLNRANYKKLHQRRPRGLLAQIERAEVRRIAGGAAIRFGSSCLLAAEKD